LMNTGYGTCPRKLGVLAAAISLICVLPSRNFYTCKSNVISGMNMNRRCLNSFIHQHERTTSSEWIPRRFWTDVGL
jgi:hypothetical protein